MKWNQKNLIGIDLKFLRIMVYYYKISKIARKNHKNWMSCNLVPFIFAGQFEIKVNIYFLNIGGI